MKTASAQHLNILVNKSSFASYQIEFNTLNLINTYIMKKLTNISPFLLLLVPVFMMMVFTITTHVKNTAVNEVVMKSKPQTALSQTAALVQK